jgi:hypothetical protein
VGDDCTLEQYTDAYARQGKMLNSDVKSPEGLDRTNLKKLLPDPSVPKLKGVDGKGPWLIVVGHDPDHFLEESFRMIKISKSINRKYTQP